MSEENVKLEKKSPQISVRLLQSTGDTVLVEWEDSEKFLHRCYLPSTSVSGTKKVDLASLEMGVPFGIPWEVLLQLNLSPADVANRLRVNGIWTADDLFRNPRVVISSIEAALGLTLASLIEAASKFESEVSRG